MGIFERLRLKLDLRFVNKTGLKSTKLPYISGTLLQLKIYLIHFRLDQLNEELDGVKGRVEDLYPWHSVFINGAFETRH